MSAKAHPAGALVACAGCKEAKCTTLFDSLSDTKTLGVGWHLATKDARRNFIGDAYSFSDTAHGKDMMIHGLAAAIREDAYRTRPLLQVDVPKSPLAVRPGSAVEIDDSVVLWAISSLVAPAVDSHLPENVYSWRVKEKPGKDGLFREDKLVQFPFLKSSTVSKYLDVIEPWYEAWPRYQEKVRYDFEAEGYSHLVQTDIVSYFENINREILFDTLKMHLPAELRILHFLAGMLNSWSTPSPHGGHSSRGIPQGNGVFSFLGNMYLLPLDTTMVGLETKGAVKYYRYMDDVTILARTRGDAVEALFEMNRELRRLNLNLQGAKTQIYEGERVRAHLIDSRFERVNRIVSRAGKKPALPPSKRTKALELIHTNWKALGPARRALKEGDLRLYHRLLTGYRLLQAEPPIKGVLAQMRLNSSHKVMDKSLRFLVGQGAGHAEIARQCLERIREQQFVTGLQEVYYLDLLRGLRRIPDEAADLAIANLQSSKHWYVKQASAHLLCQFPLQPKTLKQLQAIFFDGPRTHLRRALTMPLAQLKRPEYDAVVRAVLRHPDSMLQRNGLFLEALMDDHARAKIQLNALARIKLDWVLAERIHELDVILKNHDVGVRKIALRCTRTLLSQTSSPMLKTRLTHAKEQLAA